MSDQATHLCSRAKTGDAVAASELIDLFYEKIFCYFRRLCGNDEDAQDLTQKTFVKVWSSLPSFQDRSSFSTWIHGIGRHVYLDWFRRKDRSEIQTDAWWETCAADVADPQQDAAEQDLARQLYALVDQLGTDSKEVVHLHYYQGLSLKETAEVLGIATSTVKYRLRGALDVLRGANAALSEHALELRKVGNSQWPVHS